MKILNKIMISAIAVAGLTAAANATPVSGIVFEDGPSDYYMAGSLTPDHVFRDFSNGTNDPLLELTGDTTIYGSVTHRNDDQYADGFTIDFGTDFYTLDFAWQNTLDTPLDFRARIQNAGGTSDPGSLISSSILAISDIGSFAFGGYAFSGLWTFIVDPRLGQNDPRETMNWQLAMTDVAPVPLPAGAVLLLGALGGLAAMRRRKTAA